KPSLRPWLTATERSRDRPSPLRKSVGSGCLEHPGLPQGQQAWTRDGAKRRQSTGTPPACPQGCPCQEHSHPRRTEDRQTQTQQTQTQQTQQTQQQDGQRSPDDTQQQSRPAQQLGQTQQRTQRKEKTEEEKAKGHAEEQWTDAETS
ncbi:unnamed protein product, partial [Closterium sp. NIES-53]